MIWNYMAWRARSGLRLSLFWSPEFVYVTNILLSHLKMNTEYWQGIQNRINEAHKEMDVVFEGQDTTKTWTSEMNAAWKKWHSLERATSDPFGKLRRKVGIEI